MTQIEEKLKSLITKSMIAKTTTRTEALRSIKARFDLLNSSGKNITEEDQIKEIQKMIKERNESADIYIKNNRQDLHDVERFQISVIAEFLPTQLTREEVKSEIDKVIAEFGTVTIRDMGKIIGAVSKKLSGKTDGKTISDIVKEIIQ